MKPDNLWRAASARVEAVRVKGSALNPLLWLGGIVTPLSLLLSFFATEAWKAISFLAIAVAPVILISISYIVLLRRDPDRLQSEGYRLVQRAFKMLYRRGSHTEIVEITRDIVRTQKSLPHHDNGGME